MNIKSVTTPLAYRFATINLTQEGGLHASIQIGSVSQIADPVNPESFHTCFNPITDNNHYLQKSEVDTILGASVAKDEKGSLREVLEARIESFLRGKGSLAF